MSNKENILMQGTRAVFEKKYDLADKLLRQVINNLQESNYNRAYACYMLAYTSQDFSFRTKCYEAAVNLDPSDENRDRLKRHLSGEKQNDPIGTTEDGFGKNRTAPFAAARSSLVYGVKGALGITTAFYVDQRGLMATSRSALGSRQIAMLVSKSDREYQVRVVRSYPEYDLAFLRRNENIHRLTPQSDQPIYGQNAPLIVRDYLEKEMRGMVHNQTFIKESDRYWISTNITHQMPSSFIGSPIYNAQGDVVGMMTRTMNRKEGLLYGLHIGIIQKLRNEYFQEIKEPQHVYCGKCGSLSRAGYEDMLYCEVCGGIFPQHEHKQRVFYQHDAERYATYYHERIQKPTKPFNDTF